MDWAAELGKVGLTVTGQLGAGMDGAVFALADGSVAKVWSRQDAATLARLRDFYAQLDGNGLPFATPMIHEIRSVAGTPVTVERHLEGCPLSERIAGRADGGHSERAMRTFVEVLAALREVPVPSTARTLAVMDEPEPFYASSDDTWPAALERLVCRRVDAFGPPLRRAVADLDTLLDQVVGGLRALPDGDRSVIHGDLCTPNLLVGDKPGDNLDVVSVLDWGYLSMEGDPAFDASLAAGFFDMYGDDARAIDQTLTRWIAVEFGYPVELLALYRAVYAIAGACAYDPDGRDGHFAWCVDQLRRPDLRTLLR
ncbi:phosphotransferase [Actinopolymorpha sp. B9G3]|uniref:phosphotransferase family protein n=1 Tax=Actinopolymorpha sp. B9G3 TaxID=3158970 RepID=UPI0032D9A923